MTIGCFAPFIFLLFLPLIHPSLYLEYIFPLFMPYGSFPEFYISLCSERFPQHQ